jgi:hypothetical protein
MTVSNLFLLLNKELFARLKSPTTDPGFVLGGLDSRGFDRNSWFKYSKNYE